MVRQSIWSQARWLEGVRRTCLSDWEILCNSFPDDLDTVTSFQITSSWDSPAKSTVCQRLNRLSVMDEKASTIYCRFSYFETSCLKYVHSSVDTDHEVKVLQAKTMSLIHGPPLLIDNICAAIQSHACNSFIHIHITLTFLVVGHWEGRLSSLQQYQKFIHKSHHSKLLKHGEHRIRKQWIYPNSTGHQQLSRKASTSRSSILTPISTRRSQAKYRRWSCTRNGQKRAR